MRLPMAAASLTVGDGAPVGTYRYRRATDSWWWSDEVYLIHGFQPGEVVPTSELLMAHKHPADRARVEHIIAVEIPRTGSFCFRHQIVDAHRQVRSLVAVGQSDVDPATHQVIGLSGYFIDLTESERRHTDGAVTVAMNESLEHRAVIEQAKGVLMGAYGIDPEAAFALLSSRSQLLNVKVRELAATLVRQFSGSAPADGPTDALRRISGALQLDG